MKTTNEVTEYTAVKTDILITNDEMLEALSRYTGKRIESFVDEPTQNAWWLTVAKNKAKGA